MDNTKEQIRVCLSNVYDLQKLRVAAGNRIVQSFYIQLGVNPGESPKKSDADSKDVSLIKSLLLEYKRVSDVIAEGRTVKAALKVLLAEEKNPIKLLKSDTDYWLIDSYKKLMDSEEQATKVVERYVKAHPLWDSFFANIKGAGPLMAGVCIAYFDPYKARHVSSFWKYAGLDTVQDKDKDGNMLYLTCDGNKRTVKEVLDENNNTRYIDIESGEEYFGDVVAKKHGRRKGDTELFEYIDKDGNKAMKRGITYNPVLKTKLMGVLTGCLIKAKDPTYSTIYYDYKARLENESGSRTTPGQRNMMAQRYMIKQFIRNLWVAWRTIEGLDVDLPYEVAKLGKTPHKYNKYHCDSANVTTTD